MTTGTQLVIAEIISGHRCQMLFLRSPSTQSMHMCLLSLNVARLIVPPLLLGGGEIISGHRCQMLFLRSPSTQSMHMCLLSLNVARLIVPPLLLGGGATHVIPAGPHVSIPMRYEKESFLTVYTACANDTFAGSIACSAVEE